MNIMSLFSGGKPAPAAQQQPGASTVNNPSQQMEGAQSQQIANIEGKDVASQNSPPPKSPLDEFSKLWQPSENNAENSLDGPLFDFDAGKIMEASKKANFAQSVKPEIMQAALKGDINAFSEILNSVSQQSFAHATIAATKLIEQANTKSSKSMFDKIPHLVKQHMATDSLTQNPLYQHEATRPVLEAVKSQLAQQHPNATASQISEMAIKYMNAAFEVSRPQNGSQQQQKGTAKEEDWSSFL